jgi:hypothetical protein
VLDSNNPDSTSTYAAWRATSDFQGLDPYPCRPGKPCDFTMIDRHIAAANAAGLRYWAVVQAFEDGDWRWPTPDEETTMLRHWAASRWEGYAAFAWQWAGRTLDDQPGLVRALATFNSGTTTSTSATLAERLGIEQAADALIDLGDRPAAAHPGRKLLTLVHSMLAGGDCIDDADLLRCGATSQVLGHRVMAPSTLGTFLRSFTFGHTRQLDRLTETVLAEAWAAGAGPGDGPMTMDLDSTVCQVHGYHKQGAAYGYTHTLGYHPLVATRADSGEVLHARQRTGRANTARGAARFVCQRSSVSPGGWPPVS